MINRFYSPLRAAFRDSATPDARRDTARRNTATSPSTPDTTPDARTTTTPDTTADRKAYRAEILWPALRKDYLAGIQSRHAAARITGQVEAASKRRIKVRMEHGVADFIVPNYLGIERPAVGDWITVSGYLVPKYAGRLVFALTMIAPAERPADWKEPS